MVTHPAQAITEMNDPRRSLPSMDALLNEPKVEGWVNKYGRETVKNSLRSVIDEIRSADLEKSSSLYSPRDFNRRR